MAFLFGLVGHRWFLPFLMVLGAQLTVSEDSSPGDNLDPGYVPYPTVDSLGQANFNRFCDLTLLSVDEKEYSEHCGLNSDSKWPCFTHPEFTLHAVNVEPWFEPLDMSKELIVNDKSGDSFTMRNTSIAFVIYYQQAVGTSLRFYDFEKDTGCYKIHLTGTKKFRINVSGDANGEADLDTENYKETGGTLCHKLLNIHVGQRRFNWKVMKDNDGSNI